MASLPTHAVMERAVPVAMQALFARWGIQDAVADRQTLCSRASYFGLRCLNDYGSWQDLRGYNRPALLALKGRSEDYLTLLGIEQQYALIATEQGVIPLTLQELETYWSGEFVLLWQPPLNGISAIAYGANEHSVQWLQNALSVVDGQGASASNFDHRLLQRLRAFQRSRGLVADGIAGPRTLIHLNNLLEQRQVPLLVAAFR